MIGLLLVSCFAIIILIWVAVALSRPMTLCITFDDGFKVHSEIAAPMVEEFGWRAAFSVPTAIIDTHGKELTKEQLHDFRISSADNKFMSWIDLNRLLEAGHEIYPHTLDHTDLLGLERAGLCDEMRRQVSESRRQIIENLGFSPRFFCSPHNRTSDLIRRVVHENRMELLNCYRRNYPRYTGVEPPVIPISEYLCHEYGRGESHVDIMIHGIDARHEGWEPFETINDFRKLLEDIKAAEDAGIIKVVQYQSAHRPYSFSGSLLRFCDRVLNKLRQIYFDKIRRGLRANA